MLLDFTCQDQLSSSLEIQIIVYCFQCLMLLCFFLFPFFKFVSGITTHVGTESDVATLLSSFVVWPLNQT